MQFEKVPTSPGSTGRTHPSDRCGDSEGIIPDRALGVRA